MSQLDSAFIHALAYAVDAHLGQKRRGTDIPYASHILAVATIVLDDGGSQDEAIAALLHDALEDTDVTADDIEQRFGLRVRRIVEACSDTTRRPKPPWRGRKEAILARLEREDLPAGTLRVVLADKVHNTRTMLREYLSIGPELWPRFNKDSGGRDGQLWYARQLHERFVRRLGADNVLVREHGQLLDALESLIEQREGVSVPEDGWRPPRFTRPKRTENAADTRRR